MEETMDVSTTPKKTRRGKGRRPRRMIDKQVAIRSATSDDGAVIEQMLKEDGLIFEGVDWSAVNSAWLVAEKNGEVQAVVQLYPGKPIAHIDNLLMHKDTSTNQRGRLTHMLLRTGYQLLKNLGAQVVLSVIDPRYPSFHCVAKRYGATHLCDGAIYAYPLGGLP